MTFGPCLDFWYAHFQCIFWCRVIVERPFSFHMGSWIFPCLFQVVTNPRWPRIGLSLWNLHGIRRWINWAIAFLVCTGGSLFSPISGNQVSRTHLLKVTLKLIVPQFQPGLDLFPCRTWCPGLVPNRERIYDGKIRKLGFRIEYRI